MTLMFKIVLQLLLGAMILSCATPAKIEYITIPDFKSVAIVQAADLPSIEKLKDKDQRILDAATTGSASGGVAGMLTGVLLCGATGPLAGLCISTMGMAGMVTGGAGGLIYGAATAAEGEHADSINRNLASVSDKYDYQLEMHNRLISQVPADETRQREQADIIVSPLLSSITVQQLDDEEMYLVLTGNLIFSWTHSNGEEYFGKAKFDYKSATAPIVQWNENQGAMYEEAILDGLQDLAEKMAERVSARIVRGEQNIKIDQENLL
ncbi:hypothetical protein EYC98_14430 [Halieaceae bacterium IMCC14734]|uniref:Lipoprotein n=1 Tax=Candidatus Litorirhabdus singularis TaxID=2518993 RepID=A0ABT3TIF3_9GAMM|nr:hypothetical protein [Candidatus Litorirhabdus singularis]MCX2982056.1 hypothetical protein [Candidatus Litorirhabdus singularis]